MTLAVHRKGSLDSLERLMTYADHPVFWPLVSDYRYQMFAGGRGSGKSFNITEAMILMAGRVQ